MAWWKTAQTGDKIVCVDDAPLRWPVFPLTKGRVYTVSQIKEDRYMVGPDAYDVCVGVFIAEDNGDRDAYAPWRFRPVRKARTETGMAMLRQYLLTARAREGELL